MSSEQRATNNHQPSTIFPNNE